MNAESQDAAEARQRLSVFERDLRAVIDRHVALAGGAERHTADTSR